MKTRCYCIVNQYMSGIHAGIQSSHAIADLLTAAFSPTTPYCREYLVRQWSCEDKTIIILNGGYQSNLERIFELMEGVPHLPSAKFHEERDALNGALTALAIILPEYMYDPQYNTSRGHPLDDPYNQPHPMHGLTEYRDPESGLLVHRYKEEERCLISAIKALHLKGE